MLGVITNISIAFLPILMKIMQPEMWQNNLYILLMILCGFPFILWKFQKRFSTALVIDRENFRFRKRRFNATVRILAYYVWTFFVPIRMGWYHQAGFKYNRKWEKINIWTVISWVLMIFLMRQGIAGWWFILGILPNANLFATNSFLQDRYLYFGSIGLAILLAPVFYWYPALLIIALTFYGTRAYMYSRQLTDDESLYRENWRNHKNSDYAVNNLSFFLIYQKRFEEARVVIMRGLQIDPMNKMLWYNLGVTWAATGNLKSDEGKFKFLRAVDCWKKAMEIEPRWKKPQDDLKKMIDFLIANRIITPHKEESAKGLPTIDIPIMGVKNATRANERG